MQVGIAGAGAIGMGYAAFLLSRGHDVGIWSPSGVRTADILEGSPLIVSGALSGEFRPDIRQSAAELADADVIVLALPAYGQRAVIDALIPHLQTRHQLIISGHLSFSAVYLYRKLESRGLLIPIVALNTTVLTCKAQTFTTVKIGSFRRSVSAAVLPKHFSDQAMITCRTLFGEVFAEDTDILALTLSNLNPQAHLAIALCNLTRLERAEIWGQRENITPAVGRLIEALDRERLAIAQAFEREVPSVFDHYKSSFGLEGQSVAEISALQVENGKDVAGPSSIETRYVLEDVPFGLVPLVYLAEWSGVQAPLHRSGVVILSACYGRNFADANDLLTDLDLDDPLIMGPPSPSKSATIYHLEKK